MTGDGTTETLPPLQLWPHSPVPDRTADGVSDTVAVPLADRRVSPRLPEVVTGDEYKRQMELLQQRLGQVQAELAELERSVAATDETASLTTAPQHDLSRREQLLQETARLMATTAGVATETDRQNNRTSSGSDVRAAPKEASDPGSRFRLYNPARETSPSLAVAPKRRPATVTELSGSQRAKVAARTFDAPAAVPTRSSAKEPAPRVGHVRKPAAASAPSVSQGAARAAESPVPAVNGATAAASLKVFEGHLLKAEQHLQRRRYTQAAESFALASAYLPSSARAQLGRSHALLAAGEYPASALALVRAIELHPQDALKKIDLVRIVGGADAFVARFNELDEAVETGKTPQLQLLLAYIYYQMERPEEAKTAVAAARYALPMSISVGLLERAIGL
jgi:tetratricopeptide (TPR) repeat protein